MSFFDVLMKKPGNKISDKELKEMLESSNPPFLIDVRTPEEYTGGHIPKSTNIPVDIIDTSIKEMQLKPDSPIVVYCQSGMRSSRAADTLNRLGFKEVYNLGGIGNWSYELKR